MMVWLPRDATPPGETWSPPLIVRLSDGTYRLGRALMQPRRATTVGDHVYMAPQGVHTWFWHPSDKLSEECSRAESCYQTYVTHWALAPTTTEIVLGSQHV